MKKGPANRSSLNAWQGFGLLALAFGTTDEERRPTLTQFKEWFGVNKEHREPLIDAGLLERDQQGRSFRVSLTDEGWAWVAKNLGAPLPNTQKAAPVLAAVLRRLGPFLERQAASLAEFASGDATSAAFDQVDLAERIRLVGLQLGGGPRHRVRLAELRSRLANVERATLDATLLDLQRQGRLVLYRIDDPQDIRPEDTQAALMIAGNPRHILYLEQD